MSAACRVVLAVLLLVSGAAAQAPTGPWLEEMRRGAASMRSDPAEAERHFASAVRLAPGMAEAHLDLGLAQLRQGKLDAAIGSLEQAIHLDPRAPGAHLFLGIAYFQMNRMDESLAALHVEAERDANNVEAATWLGIVALGAERPEEAIAPLDRAARLAPQDLNVLDYRARAHSLVAAETYRRMREIDADSWHVHRALAQNFAEMGQPAEAVKEYEAALAKQPNNADLYEALGSVYQSVSKFDEAKKVYRRELELSPGNPVALYNLGRIEVENGDPGAGVPLLEQAVPRLTHAEAGRFYLGLGLVKQGRDGDAVGWLEKSLEGSPSEFIRQSAYFQLAKVYQRLHRPEDAARVVEQLKQMKAKAARPADAAMPAPQP